MLRYISYFLLLVFCASAQAVEVEIASKRYLIEIDVVKTFLPYESSHNLSSKNDSITRLIYSIHSASYSAKNYFNRATALVDKVSDQKNKTLIISPHILPKSCLRNPKESNILYWEFPAFWGTSRGMFNDKRVSISSYEVTDRILEQVVTGGNFANLKTIIILGHSGGGQMVNRYAASGMFETKTANPMGIEVRYIIMAPSSYVYFNNERVVKGTLKEFAIPENAPEGFNNWGYGLGTMFTYHKKFKISSETITERYASKKILYLVGSKDKNEDDSSLDKKPPAILQGKHRLERGRIYYNYLIHFFGEQVKQTQYLRVIRGAGHSGRSLMLSPPAIQFTFSPNSKERQKTFSGEN
ncbi:MAG: hypothetical protein ACYTFK_10630 [Planctomycetota bacterium]|jgi:hypothetical protein